MFDLNLKRANCGILTEVDGSIYTGEFRQFFDGNFSNSKSYVKHDTGCVRYVNGDVLQCTWKDDVLCGAGTIIYKNGDVFNAL